MDDPHETSDEEQESSSVYTAETVGIAKLLYRASNANTAMSSQYLEYQGSYFSI